VRLELHINGSFFYAAEIEEKKMAPFAFQFKSRVSMNQETVNMLVMVLKAHFYKQLSNVSEYEIYFVAESRGDSIII